MLEREETTTPMEQHYYANLLADIKIGRVEIKFAQPPAGKFHVGRDCTLHVDGEPINLGGLIKGFTLRVNGADPVTLTLETVPTTQQSKEVKRA